MAKRDNWSQEELSVALTAYLEVLAWKGAGTSFSPTAVHRDLAKCALSGRSEGSIARRMSNISAVLKEAGEPWVERYKPSFDHVGLNVTSQLLGLLAATRDDAGKATADPAILQSRANAMLARGKVLRPLGATEPYKQSKVSTEYSRCAQVVA